MGVAGFVSWRILPGCGRCIVCRGVLRVGGRCCSLLLVGWRFPGIGGFGGAGFLLVLFAGLGGG